MARGPNDGDIWSLIRDIMSQGATIHQDYINGNYRNYEEYSARLDAASSARIEEVKHLFNPKPTEGQTCEIIHL
jgi:hypothetical protein